MTSIANGLNIFIILESRKAAGAQRKHFFALRLSAFARFILCNREVYQDKN